MFFHRLWMGGGLFLVFILWFVPSVSTSAPQSGFSRFQKIPKHPSVQIPQLPKTSPAMQAITECNDPDGGDALVKGSAGKMAVTLQDRCVLPKPSGSLLQRMFYWYQRAFGFSLGLHDGNYHTKLEEAVCKGEPKAPAYADLDCAAINMSCMDGRCQTTKCEMDYQANELHYNNGFILRNDGELENSERVDKKIAYCKSDRMLVKRACGKVPAGKYAVWEDQRSHQTFVANQGEDYWLENEKYCHGNDVPLPCQPDIPGLPEVKVSGCVDKEKLIDAIDNYPGTGGITDHIRARPDFAYCAEDLPSECPEGGGWGSGGTAGGSGGSEGEGGGGETGGGTVNVTAVCLPMEGTEPNNPCQPFDNGVKIVGQQTQFFCNRCNANDNHYMYQYRCDANGLLDENLIRCAGGKVCAQGRCDTCNNFHQNWCGEVVE